MKWNFCRTSGPPLSMCDVMSQCSLLTSQWPTQDYPPQQPAYSNKYSCYATHRGSNPRMRADLILMPSHIIHRITMYSSSCPVCYSRPMQTTHVSYVCHETPCKHFIDTIIAQPSQWWVTLQPQKKEKEKFIKAKSIALLSSEHIIQGWLCVWKKVRARPERILSKNLSQ